MSVVAVAMPRQEFTNIASCWDSRVRVMEGTKNHRVIPLYNSGTLLSANRNGLMAKALSYPDVEWVLCLDTDMYFPPNLIDKMIERAERNNIKVLSGVYFNRDLEFMLPVASNYIGEILGIPTFMPISDPIWNFIKKHGFDNIDNQCAYFDASDEEALLEIGGCGAGCLLIHRSVLDKIGKDWFSFKRDCSEDYYFCLAATEEGFKIYLDMSVQCGHLTSKAVTFRDFMEIHREDEVMFRARILHNHMVTAARYFNTDYEGLNQRICENAKTLHTTWKELGLGILNTDAYILDQLSWATSPTFAGIIHDAYSTIITPKGEGKALIFGGGIGTEAVLLASRGWNVTHYDISDHLLRYAQLYASTVQAPGTITFTNFLSGKYDIISIIDVLEYAPNPKQILSKLVDKNLKEGGILIIGLSQTTRRDFIHTDLTHNWEVTIKDLSIKQLSKYVYQKV